MIRSISQSAGSGLQEPLRSSQKGQEEMLEQSDLVSASSASGLDSAITTSAQAAHASHNMMSRNFASAEREESRYTQATLLGVKVNQRMDDSKQSTLTSIMRIAKMEYENAETLGEKYKALQRAEKKISWHREDEVRKSAEETHLKESREALEEKGKEAMLPKDENGAPIDAETVGSAGEETPMPEMSGSHSASAPDAAKSPSVTSPVTAPAAAFTPVPVPDVSTPTVPSTPSIDITV